MQATVTTTADRKSFLRAAEVAAAILPSSGVKPGAAAVRIRMASGVMRLEANRLSDGTRAIVSVDAEGVEDGVVCVPASRLKGVLLELPGDRIELEIDSDGLKLRGEGVEFGIERVKESDVPPLQSATTVPAFYLQPTAFREAVAMVSFCAAKSATRYTFNALHLARKDQTIRLSATDGRRLCMQRLAGVEFVGDAFKAMLIPAALATMVAKLSGKSDDLMTFEIGDHAARIRMEGIDLIFVPSEGQFPPIDEVIPKDAPTRVSIGRAALTDAIRRASLFVPDGCGVRLAFGVDELTVTAKAIGSGSAKCVVKCAVAGPPLEISFNPFLFGDFLRRVRSRELTVEMTAANRPIAIHIGDDVTFILMPVNSH